MRVSQNWQPIRHNGTKQNPRLEIALLQGGKGLPAGGWEQGVSPLPTAAVQTQVSAAGERAVAIGGNAPGSTIITGSGNVVGNHNRSV